MSDGPGRITQTRISLLAGGGVVMAALDSAGRAWTRCALNGSWTRWTLISGAAADVDIAGGHGDSPQIAAVAITPSAGGEPELHAMLQDGTMIAASF